jgi:cellulase
LHQGLTVGIDRWGNQVASDHADSYTIKLPSDIKSGTYILRTELIALHGNMKELKSTALAGEVQVYPYCFNLEIVGSGTATPEGVTFPGAYKATDPGLTFQPFFTYGNSTAGATEWNSKYVSFTTLTTRIHPFLILALSF